jgi:hypothetical protein
MRSLDDVRWEAVGMGAGAAVSAPMCPLGGAILPLYSNFALTHELYLKGEPFPAAE